MFKELPKYFLIISILIISVSSCRKDELLTDPSAKIEFSQDVVLFDTVFVQTGSATQIFLVYNRNDQPVRLSSIRLATGESSYYRLNVNGVPGKIFSDVDIGAKDSLFIFVEVTIPDPTSPNTPFIVKDSILFDLNGNQQQVNLVAWGQRAHFHFHPPNKPTFFYLNKNETWSNDLPHVVYGYAMVDSGALTIDAGTKIHFHPGSGMIVLTGGKIIANGDISAPVTFQGDRLGSAYDDIPGQWDRIWLSNIALVDVNTFPVTVYAGTGPSGSVFNYTIIKNGFVGLQSDTVAVQHHPAAVLNNCIIKNFASTALYGQGTNIQANNCVFANCGEYCAALLYGGDYRFLHCTFANYWEQGNRDKPAIYINNYYLGVRPIDSAYFGNCIIYGNIDNEVVLDSSSFTTPGDFNFMFDHSLLKVDNTVSTTSPLHFKNVLVGNDPFFDDHQSNNYKLNSTSPAIDMGDPFITGLSSVLSLDLKGDVRPQGGGPDLGAYEKQ